MYDGSFGLNRRPFAAVPQIHDYFAASAIEGARTTLGRCIQRGEGSGLVIGPSGTGKSLLCMLLAEQFRRSFHVVTLTCGRLSTRRALFQAILYGLGRPYRGMDEGEARLAVVDYLMTEEPARAMVLLVDEAHTLPLRLIEEIRLLTNLVRNGHSCVRLVLFGAALLEERLAGPRLDSFSQRLAARCYLEPLSRTEAQGYIQSQIDAAGGHGEAVFPEETCQSAFQATGGVPRLINQVCDHAMVLAYVAGRRRIEPALIEEAWADLQQLPTPWTGEAKEEPAGGVIEFGSLEDFGESPSGPAESNAAAAAGLRVTGDESELASDGTEPSQQIHRIERLLAEADDDFQPAGSIGPEIELRFEETVHPFQEVFEHEEVVADRYASSVAVPNVPLRIEASVPEPEQDLASIEDETVFCEVVAEPSWELPPAPQDESDALETAVPSEPTLATAAAGEPMPRHDYRRLFARLRQG